MADNVTMTQGSGTSVATDEIGGVHYQRVKLSLGADGTANDASAGAGAVGTGTQRVTLASDDPGVTGIGSLTETAPATDTASSGLNGRLQRIAQRITSLIALVPASLGSKAAASSFAVTDSTEDIARMGIVTETAPASDTASSGLNGRLQRIAQRITTFLATAGDPADAAWTSGSGTHTSLLKAIAGAAISATPAEVRVTAAEFETVAASSTDQMLGATGGAGDTLSGLLVVPATTSPGAVSIEYGSTNITVFAGGASSVSNLIPFYIPLENIAAPSGGWEITTGSNVSVIAFGNFT